MAPRNHAACVDNYCDSILSGEIIAGQHPEAGITRVEASLSGHVKSTTSIQYCLRPGLAVFGQPLQDRISTVALSPVCLTRPVHPAGLEAFRSLSGVLICFGQQEDAVLDRLR